MSKHTCPACEKGFDTRRGLGVHHSSVHGERLPNRECARCGAEFHCDYAKKYCSEKCRDSAVSYEGENNPNYRGGQDTASCEICGTDFEYYPSEKPGKYCPKCVENETWRHSPDFSGANNPRWSGGKQPVQCDICDGTFERHPGMITGEATLCSRECHTEWLSEAFIGEGHPNWLGGGTGSYGKGWNQVRQRALERDDYACVLCGTDADELGRNPDVHHLIPVRAFVESPLLTVEDAHTLDNVVSLCPTCHRRAEFGHYSKAELRWRAGVQANEVSVGPGDDQRGSRTPAQVRTSY